MFDLPEPGDTPARTFRVVGEPCRGPWSPGEVVDWMLTRYSDAIAVGNADGTVRTYSARYVPDLMIDLYAEHRPLTVCPPTQPRPPALTVVQGGAPHV